MAGCGGGGGMNNGLAPVVENTTNAPVLNSSPSVSLPVGEAEKEVNDFEFSVLPESFLSEEDHADLSMELIEGSATVTLRINAENAEQLRALYFQVLYDANEFSPIGVDVASRFGQPEDMLTATFMQTRGLVQHGQVLIDPFNQDGFSGSATLAELRFMREPATLLRGTRTTPTTSGSAAVLITDEENHQLTWGYASVGDYDQNLETNVADLTPIATRLLKGGPFSYFDIDDVIDGDGNDEINIADITPIGVNFRNRVLAYNVYKTLDQNDYPAANDAPSTISRVGQVLYEEASGSRFTERLRFAFDVGTTDPDAYYWVRPTDNFLEGTPSNIAAYGAVGIPLPTADLQADVTTGEVPLTVNFDASASVAPSSSIVDFEWDLDGDGTFNESDNGEDLVQGSSTAQFTYNMPGLVNVSVRVSNSFNLKSSASVGITPTEQPNVAPTASISADVSSGELPLAVNFDASASFDSDGTIVLYEWDFDGDGTFDSNTGTSPSAGFVYSNAGTYDPVVRVTDDDGAVDTASLTESGGSTLDVNRAPVADIAADTLSGTLPLTVNFDASGSSDLDGSIVLFEWDFEGDGTFESSTGSTATTSFTYTAGGTFDPAVRVTDDKGATDTASISETVGGGITVNIAPTAAISADTLSGNLPLTINFDASASSDVDGTIVSYEWDFDGDGSWDLDTGTTATTSFEYTTSGNFDPAVRVTDDDGASDVASLSENGGGTITINAAPTAVITGSPLSGTLPLTVDFDASASSDSDGTIVKYEWDFDGDGSWDLDTGTTATTSFEYTTAGNFDPAVRVTDDDGATGIAHLSENDGLGTGIDINDPPVAAISASPLSGPLPLTVNFDASASTDSDGTIVSYEWDFDGDGIWDENSGTSPTTSFEYTVGGSFDAAVRVTDNDGATDVAHLSDGGGTGIDAQEPPLADITATPNSGPAPLVVSFDASGSSDPDGSITLYEWDLDFNGSFETSTGSTPNTGSTYIAPGVKTISVRVTDDDGLTDTASVNVDVTSGWSTGNVILSVSLDSKVSIASFDTGSNARLGLAYKNASGNDLYFVRTTDNTGYNWGTPIAVQTTGQVGNDCTLADIGGYPGITFKRAQSKLDYIQATATDGSTWWANSIEIDGGGGAGAFTSLAFVDGKPAASGIKSGQDKLRYVGATNANGTSWNTPIDVDPAIGSEEMEFTDLGLVNGNPGILFNYVGTNTGLKFVRSTNASGSAWGSSVTIDAPTAGGRYPSLHTVSGNPAASYQAFALNQLRYSRASNVNGSSWNTPVVIDSGTDNGQWTTLSVVDGVPVIAYYDGGNGDLKFATATDATGTSWNTAVLDSTGDVGKFANMTLLNGSPVIAYYDVTNSQLKIAIYVPAP
ncbi:PKD domain-containing protein [bacterium]|nr:PKD domain-containing protein [bacterium]